MACAGLATGVVRGDGELMQASHGTNSCSVLTCFFSSISDPLKPMDRFTKQGHKVNLLNRARDFGQRCPSNVLSLSSAASPLASNQRNDFAERGAISEVLQRELMALKTDGARCWFTCHQLSSRWAT